MAINREAFIKLMIPALIGVSLIITIVEQLRQIGILFFAVGSIAWFLLLIKKVQFLTNDDETDRMLKWFLYPATLLNILFLITSKIYRDSGTGWIYLILSVFSILIYLTPEFKKNVIGIDKRVTKGIFWGVGIAFGFIFLSKISPNFSLLTPQLPFSLVEGVKAIILIGFAPILESGLFRSALLHLFQETYGMSFTQANLLQGGILFPSYHALAYGILLSSYSNLIELFGATQAILGSLIVAGIFGVMIGYLVKRFGTLLVEIIPHAIINGFIFFTLSVGTFFSIG